MPAAAASARRRSLLQLQLIRWFQEELPTTLAARKDDPHITKDELIKLVGAEERGAG